MAKNSEKKIKAEDVEEVKARKGFQVKPDDDDGDGDVPTGRLAVDSDEEEKAEDTDKKGPAILEGIGEIAPKQAQVVDAAGRQLAENALCTFVCLKAVEHAPVVGLFKFTDYNIQELKPDHRYTIPVHVARHLVDRGYGTIVS